MKITKNRKRKSINIGVQCIKYTISLCMPNDLPNWLMSFSTYVWFDVLICFVFLYPNSRKYLYFMSKCRINFLGILDIRIDYIFLVSGYKISMNPSNLITILNCACWACTFLCSQASVFAQKINFARPPATIQYFLNGLIFYYFAKSPFMYGYV